MKRSITLLVPALAIAIAACSTRGNADPRGDHRLDPQSGRHSRGPQRRAFEIGHRHDQGHRRDCNRGGLVQRPC